MKKFVAALLTASVVFSLTGCQKINDKKIIKTYQDILDAEEEDAEKVVKKLERHDYTYFDDGYYFLCDKGDTKDVYSAIEMDEFFGKPGSIISSVNYLYADEKNNGERAVVFISYITLDDKDAVDELFEDTEDIWDDFDEDYVEKDSDIDDDRMLAVFEDDWGDATLYLGIYREGNSAIIIVSVNDTDLIEDFCGELDIESPSDI